MIPHLPEDYDNHWHRADQRQRRERALGRMLATAWFAMGLIGTAATCLAMVSLYLAWAGGQ